jgi:hypothetical protein
MQCTKGRCGEPGTRRLLWREMVRPGWILSADRLLCPQHCAEITKRLDREGIDHHTERAPQPQEAA